MEITTTFIKISASPAQVRRLIGGFDQRYYSKGNHIATGQQGVVCHQEWQTNRGRTTYL